MSDVKKINVKIAKIIEQNPRNSDKKKSSQKQDDKYHLIQYIIDDEESLQISKFECDYRATRRDELTRLFLMNGCNEVTWKMPEETGFYQPIVIAKKFVIL